MDIQDKHRVTLLNAKCEVVCKVKSIFDRLEYGDVETCCSRKLFLAIKLINRLECYVFGSETNCIEETDLPKMYATLANLLS